MVLKYIATMHFKLGWDMIINHPYLFSFLLLVFCGLLFSLPIFSFLDSSNSKQHNHNHTMDSVRYFLASFVFISHATRMIGYVTNGTWKSISPELNYMAVFGVSIFFSITAVLFWGKIRDKDLDFIKLYTGRFFRIVPLIFFNSIIVLMFTILMSGGKPDLNFMYWLDPINNNRPDFNAFKGAWVLTGGVFWTLVYEWGFYFALPLLYMFRKNKIEISITIMFFFLYVSSYVDVGINYGVIMPFIIGMLAIDISEKININKFILNIVLILSILSLFYFMPRLQSITSISCLIMLLIMICIIKNADAFGFLKIKGFQRLGAASYSIYVMHALYLYIIFKFTHKIGFLNENMDIVIVLSSVVILFSSSLTYRYIEMPFINIGRKIKL